MRGVAYLSDKIIWQNKRG